MTAKDELATLVNLLRHDEDLPLYLASPIRQQHLADIEVLSREMRIGRELHLNEHWHSANKEKEERNDPE